MLSATRTLAAALVGSALLASGCDYSPQQQTARAQPSDESFRDFGSYEVHYNALRTDALQDLKVVDAGDVEMYSGDIEVALPALEAAVANDALFALEVAPADVTASEPSAMVMSLSLTPDT